MISFSSDNQTSFPTEELDNKCKICGEKTFVTIDKEGYPLNKHIVKKDCKYNQVNTNYGAYIIHTKFERPYPRPITKCRNCFQDIIFIWNNMNKASWKHCQVECGVSNFNQEMIEFARILLLYYLIEGNKLTIRAICKSCKITHYQFKTPKLSCVDVKSCLFSMDKIIPVDIGCVDENSNLVGILQLNGSNTIDRSICRNAGLFYFELNYKEIIKKLDTTKEKRNISLFNNRSMNCKMSE